MITHKPTSKRLILLLSSSLPAIAMCGQNLPASTSPLAAGYAERARIMDLTENPLGVIDQLSRFDALTKIDGTLLLAKAYYERGDVRCVDMLNDFITENPASPEVETARLLLADFYFFNQDFPAALLSYKEADIESLSPGDASKYLYRKSVSMIKCGYYTEAVSGMKRLRKSNDYAAAATFYLGYIEYANKNYDTAYDLFKESWEIDNGMDYDVDDMQTPRTSMRRKYDYVPTGLEAGYYMAQIDFLHKKYDKVINAGKSILFKILVPELAPEMQRIVGESYFKTEQPELAKDWLEVYMDTPELTPAPTAIYSLGVIEYDEGNYERAEELFGQLTNENDELAQSAYLYLGQCAIHNGETDLAAMSFKKAYALNYDRDISETALYNYITATTRGGNVPFSSSIPLLKEFVTKYADSKRAAEVEEYLAVAYYNEKDFSSALEAINRIKNPSSKALAAKQKILFGLGVREMSNDNPADAEIYLRQALDLGRYNSQIATQTSLWLGDAQYALKKYAAADKSYTQYVKNDKNSENTALALYNLAYSLYMQDKFKDAMQRFDEALKAKPALSKVLAADARMRKADCLYYTGNLEAATNLYTEVANDGSSDADYALMRKAVIAGVNEDNAAKAKMLSEMMQLYPDSKWLATAMLEQAVAYSEDGNSEKALETFENLSERFPDAPETRNALLQMALLNNRGGNTQAAIESYKSLISKWPTSDEARIAGDDLRILYAQNGNLQDLNTFLKSVPGAPQLDSNEIEKLTFEAAATAYATGDNADKLIAYTNQYPNGKYLAQALRDIAEYQYRDMHQPNKALATIEQLMTSRPNASQIPGALLLKGEILEQSYPQQTAEILQTYRELENKGGTEYAAEAWSGIMRNTTDPEERAQYARRLKDAGGVSAEAIDEASLYEATGLLDSGNKKEGYEILSSLAQKPLSSIGAKAAVTLAEHYLSDKRYNDAMSLMESFTDSGTPHQYWLARGYISLADAYKALGKKSLALEYITSLKDNYPGNESDIAEMINKRLKSWK